MSVFRRFIEEWSATSIVKDTLRHVENTQDQVKGDLMAHVEFVGDSVFGEPFEPHREMFERVVQFYGCVLIRKTGLLNVTGTTLGVSNVATFCEQIRAERKQMFGEGDSYRAVQDSWFCVCAAKALRKRIAARRSA